VGTNSFCFIAASADRRLHLDAAKDLDVVMFVLRSRPLDSVLYDRLVFVEEFTSMRAAQNRLDQIRRMSSKKRAALVTFTNPEWKDLAQAWFPLATFSDSLEFDDDFDEGGADADGGIVARIPKGPPNAPRAGAAAKEWPTDPSVASWP
jgi:hypothetical protein